MKKVLNAGLLIWNVRIDMVARPRIAVIDYGMGNLFSIKNACLVSGMEVKITVSRRDIIDADAVILP